MIIELVKAEAIKGLDEYARKILADEKAIVGAHSRSGAALGSLHIEKTGEFSRFIGATGGKGGLHAFYLDEGNGGKVIKPKRGESVEIFRWHVPSAITPIQGHPLGSDRCKSILKGETMAKEKKPTEVTEEKVEAVEEEKKDKGVDVEAFIARKLTAINQMEDEAKARNLASRVLSNRKG